MPTASRDPRLDGYVAFSFPDFTTYEVARFCIVLALEMQSVAVDGRSTKSRAARLTSVWSAWRNFSREWFCSWLQATQPTALIGASCSSRAMADLLSAQLCCWQLPQAKYAQSLPFILFWSCSGSCGRSIGRPAARC